MKDSVGDQLVSLGEGIFLLVAGGGPASLVIEGRTHWRFLDRLYIPRPTRLLTPAQIIVTNRFREVALTTDQQFAHRARVRAATLAAIRAIGRGNLFEIGCGVFPLAEECVAPLYLAIEIDEEAVQKNVKRGHDCRIYIPIDGAELQHFDLIASLFAMHFAVTNEMIDTIALRTAADAVFIFNVATKDPVTRQDVALRLAKRGMSSLTVPVPGPCADTFYIASRPVAATRREEAAKALISQLEQG